MNENKEIAKRL